MGAFDQNMLRLVQTARGPGMRTGVNPTFNPDDIDKALVGEGMGNAPQQVSAPARGGGTGGGRVPTGMDAPRFQSQTGQKINDIYAQSLRNEGRDLLGQKPVSGPGVAQQRINDAFIRGNTAGGVDSLGQPLDMAGPKPPASAGAGQFPTNEPAGAPKVQFGRRGMMAPEVTPPTPGEGPASFARATRGAAPAAEAASTKVGALGRIMGSIPGMGTLGGAISKVSPVAAAAGIGYGGASAINDVLHPHNGSDIGNEALAARKDFRNAIDQGNYGEAAGQFLGHSAKQLVNVGKALGGPLVSVPLEVARGALHGLGMTGGDGIAQGAQGNLQPHINAADPGAMDRIKEIQARSPEVTSAIEAYHRQNGSVNHDTTHPGIHTAEDWARANSHLTHAQLLDLLKMAPKPVSSKDRIIGNLHNEVQSRYDAKMRAALGLKDQKAQQQAAAEARDEYLKSALPLVQGAATPFDPDLVGRLQE